jgi:hypothetical protein
MMESGVYFGLATGKGISGKIKEVASIFPNDSIKYSYSWALDGVTKCSNKPPHITLVPRTLTNTSLDENALNNLAKQLGSAVSPGTAFTLTPYIDTNTSELIAKPNPDSLDCKILRAMTDLLVRKLQISIYKNSNPHLKLAYIDERVINGQASEINEILSGIPIYFYPAMVYATYQDPTHRSRGVFSISRYHDNTNTDSMQ